MSSERMRTLPRARLFLLLCACVAAAATAVNCTSPPARRVADRECPDRPPALYAALDVSDTGRSAELTTERLTAVERVLVDAAACAGRARVVAFTASAAATDVLLDRDLKPEGATRRAQLRRLPKLVDGAMDEVRTRLDAAAGRLPAGGTDVLAQLGLAREFHRQAGVDRPLQVVVWSDGIASSPVDLNQAALDAGTAAALAHGVPVVDLSGADVTFAGVGRPAGALPPTTFVDGLKAFYAEVCRRARAACTVVTR